MEHTADLGLAVEAPDPPELFLRAARGMIWLLDEALPEPEEEIRLSLAADDLPGLLRAWLRELLFRHEAEGFAVADARFERLDDTGLEARVRGGPAPRAPVREIKGVTWHALSAERSGGGWRARVIFDV